MSTAVTLTASENDADRRLDRVLRKRFPDFPLSFISRLLREKKVLVNGKARDGGWHVGAGDTIVVKANGETGTQNPKPFVRPPSGTEKPPAVKPPTVKPPLHIIYEDDDLLVLDKPRGVLTHGENSLESDVTAYLVGKIPASLSFRPGPLHRLDRNTSGLLVFGKSLAGARFFTQATQNGQVTKRYLALVEGVLEKEEVWEDYLVREKEKKVTRAADGRESARKPARKAVTRVRPLETRNGDTLIEAEISSGKTHQIRAQCGIHGHPLCGDKKYGGGFQPNGYFLRAYRIVIEKDGKPFMLECPCNKPSDTMSKAVCQRHEEKEERT
jgi:23S rRNA pseudouridine955/2504/2580 synthase